MKLHSRRSVPSCAGHKTVPVRGIAIAMAVITTRTPIILQGQSAFFTEASSGLLREGPFSMLLQEHKTDADFLSADCAHSSVRTPWRVPH